MASGPLGGAVESTRTVRRHSRGRWLVLLGILLSALTLSGIAASPAMAEAGSTGGGTEEYEYFFLGNVKYDDKPLKGVEITVEGGGFEASMKTDAEGKWRIGVPEKGEAMARQIEEDFAALKAMRAKISARRSAVFVLAIGNGSPTVAGAHTAAEGIFHLAGADNAIRGINGYKPATPEATLAAQPQAVITMLERNHGLEAEVMFALPAFAGTPAARDKRLISVPSYYLSFGPRTAHAANKLAAAIYPELSLPQLPPRPWTAAEPAATR